MHFTTGRWNWPCTAGVVLWWHSGTSFRPCMFLILLWEMHTLYHLLSCMFIKSHSIVLVNVWLNGWIISMYHVLCAAKKNAFWFGNNYLKTLRQRLFLKIGHEADNTEGVVCKTLNSVTPKHVLQAVIKSETEVCFLVLNIKATW